jgi:hypothetical protein
MSKVFDLTGFGDVKTRAAAIYDRLGGIGGVGMPPPPPRAEGALAAISRRSFSTIDGRRSSALGGA